jgi:transglutaminase-like putative cysteine protease
LERHELDTLIATLDTVDHRGVDWSRVRWTAYLIHQQLRYEYPGAVRDLRQRLVIVPPERHGGQRLVTHKLEISQPGVEQEDRTDPFGNHILSFHVAHVAEKITFTAWIVVERDADAGPIAIGSETYHDRAFRQPSPLTMPDDMLLAAAAEWRSSGLTGVALARQISGWVHGQMRYAHGLTGVKTTAAEAFALRQGVCQDYAHVMIAICRACGLPARYVSGHLLGEGGTHAWMEVLLPGEREGDYIAHPFDPTNGTEPGLNYITIAVGRDYGDVAPTSGTFRAPYGGQLSASKRADVTALEYFAPSV